MLIIMFIIVLFALSVYPKIYENFINDDYTTVVNVEYSIEDGELKETSKEVTNVKNQETPEYPLEHKNR